MEKTKEIGSFDKSIIDLSITTKGKESYFDLHFVSGIFTGEDYQIEATGASFSGVEGDIFDSSGNFFGGYCKDKTFKIKLHKKDEYKYSYFFDDVLICNDMDFSNTGINAIKLVSDGDVSLFADITISDVYN